MKSLITTLPAWLLLLTIGGSCKKEAIIEESAPNLATCRVVREEHKGLGPVSRIPNPSSETVLVGTEVYTIYKYDETRYKYDERGRLIRSEGYGPDGKMENFMERVYYSDRVQVRQKSLNSLNTTEFTILLNSQGDMYAQIHQNDTVYFENIRYIKEGYEIVDTKNNGLLSVRSKRKNGNIIEQQVYSVLSGTFIHKYEYDTLRPAIPPVNFLRKDISRNLVTKFLLSVEGGSAFPTGPLHQTDYLYEFDKYGRVRRQIFNQKNIESGWGQYVLGSRIAVFDYTYECP
ncbi:hypothetical protein [Spirosoma montaniterrae]|uniref:DUF4595 domain-containing protein n=1 Tax=Spirosoma montaniterrae TaxID=1178516 RepID=A0A1P9WSW2_9BACT|nr:hypothetical protein [Spirosoma montaniterrae]AQG78474.1 hypothetical protein AWR27_03440 [Spirosoma montaniterrae]